jgi:hypothetical protein
MQVNLALFLRICIHDLLHTIDQIIPNEESLKTEKGKQTENNNDEDIFLFHYKL